MAAFHLFPRLPTELRIEIWRLCLPRRVLELDYQRDDLLLGPKPPCAKNAALTDSNTRIPPALSRVNREARGVALESWQPLPEPPSDSPDLAEWASEIIYGGAWLTQSPRVDRHRAQVVHLNWAPTQDVDADWPAQGDPLRYAMWVADQMPETEISIDASLLEEFQYRPNSEMHPWTREEFGDLVRRRNAFTVVVLDPLFIHGDFHKAARTGLFGLLGDAPVQIVHVDEHARLNRFVELGGNEGMRLSHDPFEDRLKDRLQALSDRLKDRLQELRDTLTAVFGPDDNDVAPRFVPAVMFRYCPHNCAPK
ncbi:hypothetical protein CONLIGDRAFT_707442 [Coniochaeta ligniaria NRRL 30616]|uniref:2EXR domain-containing protein n=1 Tax=Coniochaeta ligniaria NRRL 30616 TaxID=1408157 RepID=A0A1J7JAV1_9PEZI|nr:hypothetical protein CONLIGDRAFT_707442 [Coniochaeta ligniaria NRRL 30616]